MAISRRHKMEEINIIPEELVYKILIHLPVKSLVRLRCVCRSWYSLISNSEFIHSHLGFNKTQFSKGYNVFLKRISLSSRFQFKIKEIYSTRSDDLQQFHETETIIPPYYDPASGYGHTRIIGCVDGLLCLFDYENRIHLLWNPAIRKHFILPNVETAKETSCAHCFGFGYDALSDDYKVVMVLMHRDDVERQSTVCVFSLSSKTWRTLVYYSDLFDASNYLSIRTNHSCNVDRFVYQISQLEQPRCNIVSFDLSDEVFNVIECPEVVRADLWCEPNLVHFSGSLVLVALHKGEWRYQFWVMRDEGVGKSWMKLFSIGIDGDESLQRLITGFTVLGFTKKGMLIVVGEGHQELILSDDNTNVVIKCVQPGRRQIEWYMEPYKESMLLLKEVDNVPLSPLPWQWLLADDEKQRLSEEGALFDL